MRSFIIASSFAAAGAVTPRTVSLFDEFVRKYDRHYATEEEQEKRFQIFSENLDKIDASNAKGNSYTLGITSFTDQTVHEFTQNGLKKNLAASNNRTLFSAPDAFAEPDSIDWVTKGGVTSVKNQGSCGSCWSFSAAGALEGAMFVAGRPIKDLSMQHILACDTGGNGCGGGLPSQAFDWVEKNGVPALNDEPYQCVNGCSTLKCESCTKLTGETCVFGTCNKLNATCSKDYYIHRCECPGASECFTDGACMEKKEPAMVIAVGDVTTYTSVDQTENALEAAVAQQPVSVAIEADMSVFQHYTGGVLTNDACGSNLDHAVLAVGYGTLNGQAYWKVKNSWGSGWGSEGYVNIAKGSASEGGECGIRKLAVFPTIKKALDTEMVV